MLLAFTFQIQEETGERDRESKNEREKKCLLFIFKFPAHRTLRVFTKFPSINEKSTMKETATTKYNKKKSNQRKSQQTSTK